MSVVVSGSQPIVGGTPTLSKETIGTGGVERPIEVRLAGAAEEVSRSLIESGRSLKVAVAQITTQPGRVEENANKIIECIQKARAAGAELVTFPELTIPGYCAMDLFFNEEYVAANLRALQRIRQATEGITAVVGFVDYDATVARPGGRPALYNSAAIIKNGEILSVTDKSLLPNYEIFYEDRYFAPPRNKKVVDIGGVKLGTEICEDLWSDGYAESPTDILAKNGADLIVNISASPFHLGKLPARLALIEGAATKHKVPFVYTNLIGAFDGYEGDVVFDGRSIAVNSEGKTIALGRGFGEEIVLFDVFQGQKMVIPAVREVEELHDALVLGIKDYFARLQALRGGKKTQAILGVSGGIDSALVAALAVEALGADQVLGITMPSKYSSGDTLSDAEILGQTLGIRVKKVPIEKAVQGAIEALRVDGEYADKPENVAEENLQARTRMEFLMAFANKLGGIVLNTGNKTELALDNFTMYGDSVGALSVLGDVDKDRVYALARYINERAGCERIPQSTIDRIPTAELKPGQVDADVMGDHPQIIAPLVRSIVEEGLSKKAALARFGATYGEAIIDRVYSRMHNAEWKRRQLPGAIRVTPHAFGNGRRVPINHGFNG